MTCLPYTTLIDDYADNNVPTEQLVSFKKHIASCESCKKELDETILLKKLLKSSQSSQPSDLYFDETADLIFARTIENHDWQINQSEKSEVKIRSEFSRALFSTAAAFLVFAVSIIFGTNNNNFAENNPDSSPIFVMSPVEQLIQPNDSPVFTKAEQLNHIQGMLLISPPGMLGRLSVIHEYNRLSD